MNQYGDFGKETEELMTICERNDRIRRSCLRSSV